MTRAERDHVLIDRRAPEPAHGAESAAAESVVDLHEVVHRYPGPGRPALDGVTLSIAPGELWGILGRNGAGKTTLVRAMTGSLRPTGGSVAVYGRPPAAPGAQRSAIGYLAQDDAPMNHLTPAEALRLTSRLRGFSRAQARDERDALIDWWGLAPFARRAMRRLSGGQHQLALIAVACAGAVPLLVLDEPTSGLDPERRGEVWSRLGELNRCHGRTIVLVTHDPLEAERVLGKVVILVAGRIAAAGRPAELKRRLGSSLRVDVVGEQTAAADLPAGYDWGQVGPGLWRSLIEPAAAERLLAQLRDGDRISDVRVRSANLEDLYLYHAKRK